MAIAMLHEEPPADTIKRLLGNLEDFEIGPKQVLIAIYLRPQKTRGGIVLPRENLEEDFYQSKSGLAVKIGQGAVFNGTPIKLDDWLIVRPNDCWSVEVNGIRCRHVFDDQIRARVKEPFMVW